MWLRCLFSGGYDWKKKQNRNAISRWSGFHWSGQGKIRSEKSRMGLTSEFSRLAIPKVDALEM